MQGKIKLKRFLNKAKENNYSFMLLCHHNADPDSLGSAIAFSRYLTSMGLKNRIGVAQSVSSYAKRLLQFAEVQKNPKVEEEVIVIFDTSSLEQLEPIDLPKGKIVIVIDHHVEKENPIKADIEIVDSSRTSTAEIVWDLFEYLGFRDEVSARVILAGIVTDTANFRYANAKTFKTVSEILKMFEIQMGEIYNLVVPVTDENIDQAKRMAILKACQRMEIKKVKSYIIAISKVSSYESLACKTFLQLGADVAIVGSEKNGVRISARAKEHLIKKGLHLGKIMEKVGPIIDGSGGGHSGAAGANGKKNLDEAVKFLVKEIETFLKKR
ncbi:MAG: DHH family phosphoesterase [Thermococcus sp.]|uniref:DHH family phosphoesterase n=1 Tax=Thermococcus sp. TaxID=35749 RepID=UPI000F110AE3|nr:DHH family phosphoesterase [Thermococcus sp.]MCD6140488.1 DHH family phosphoesterase [Thermococcus sp.]MCD6143067.1 DHH family phosphoesterase [Thermococcus sp.]RLF83052.1 MAG: bifunctional oligoribonuclease/PAP phosphatase NrnA [Thermococci archaeon]HDG64166.1 bifunctional oligoribonuclease/PAP phosphatase NrnA [Thermococcus sp.]